MGDSYVWALDSRRRVLVTDDPSPPVGGRFVGSYPLPEGGGWGEAQRVAERVAAHDPGNLYEIVYEAPLTGPAPDAIDEEDLEGAEEWTSGDEE